MPIALSRFIACLCSLIFLPVLAQADITIESRLRHLGNDTVKKWAGDATAEAEGKKLEWTFDATQTTAATLLLHQRDVHDGNWQISINGHTLGTLRVSVDAVDHALAIPANTLRAGTNTLLIQQSKGEDDILVGRFRIDPRPIGEVLNLGRVQVIVNDIDRKQPVPARLTLVDAQDNPPTIYHEPNPRIAVRPGLIYIMNESVSFELPAGKYKLYATRGTEWSMDQIAISVEPRGTHTATLNIRREIDTTGFVAADTHIHTLTHSGHGDASVEERVVTLAGEGVELAIATDHNHHTDYVPITHRIKADGHFTSVVGNEVTTRIGHVNAFPLDPDGDRPDPSIGPWTRLVENIRSKGAKVVILNHPRWPQDKKTGAPAGPYREQKFDRQTGTFGTGVAFPFDGMEVINSETENHKKDTQPLWVLEEWLSLLNHGETVKAVGASDSHTVGDPVGQGRTYVASSTDDPTKIQIDEACDSFRAGRTTISLGLITDIRINGDHGVGDTVRGSEPLNIRLRVAAPSWVRPRRVLIYINGVPAEDRTIETTPGKATDQWESFTLAAPPHDAHVVGVVLGDPIHEAWWPMDWGATLAATNPIYLDVDNDGAYRSPHETAQRMLETADSSLPALTALLKQADPIIGLQMIHHLRQNPKIDQEALRGALASMNDRPAYHTYLENSWANTKAVNPSSP